VKNHLLALCTLSLLVAGCGEVVPTPPVLTDATPQPTAASLSPDHGPPVGGTVVTITGDGFGSGDAVVVVGGVEATGVTIASDSEITFTTPAYPADKEIVDVTVSTGNGFVDMPQAFRYHANPRIVAISPSSGRATGGTTVTLTGRGFVEDDAGVPTVTVAGAALTNVQIIDDQTLTGTLSAAPAGVLPFVPVDVVLENANGSSTLAGGMKLSKQGLLGMERGSPGVWYIDPGTNHAVRLSTPQTRIQACATTVTGTIFVTRTNPGEIGTLDPITGDFTAIGPTNLGVANKNVSNLQFAGTTLYGGVAPNRDKLLYSISTSTGALTQVGAALALTAHTALGPKDGASLFAIDLLNQTIDSIAVGTGVLTTGAVTITGGSAVSAMGMASFASTLYVIDQNFPSNLYTLNVGSGALTRVAVPGLTAQLHGLCTTPPSF
jgi:hypothetical protein